MGDFLNWLKGLSATRRLVRLLRISVVLAGATLVAGQTTGLAWLKAVAGICAALTFLFLVLWFRARGRMIPYEIAEEKREKQARAAEAAETRRHVVPKRAGEPKADFVDTVLELDGPFVMATPEGDVTLPPGRCEVSFRLRFEERDEDADFPICELKVDAGKGRWYQTRSYLDPMVFLAPIADPTYGADRGTRFWENAPKSWTTAFREQTLIAGIHYLLDDRERFEMSVGDESVTMMTKYQGPEIDIAWIPTQGKAVVRARKMYYEVWSEKGEDHGFEDVIDEVTFIYLVDPKSFLLPTAPKWHWSAWESWYEENHERPVFSAVPSESQ